MSKLILSFFFALMAISITYSQNMTNKKIGNIIDDISKVTEDKNGYWKFTYEQLPMICITDEKNNRMRIVAAISEMKDVSNKKIKRLWKPTFIQRWTLNMP